MPTNPYVMTPQYGDEDDSGWQLPLQHAFDVVERVGDEEAGVVEVLALAHMHRATVCTARANCGAFLVGSPGDVRTSNAFRVLDRALTDGDAGNIWQ
jgi:hypothetical protein